MSAPSPHGLNSDHHDGQISDAQAPQFLKTDGTRPLAADLPVADGVAVDGVDLSVFRNNYDSHLGDPTSHNYIRNLLDDLEVAAPKSYGNDVRVYGIAGITVTKTATGLEIAYGAGEGGTGIDHAVFALNTDLDLEAMTAEFHAIGWAQFAIWEGFGDETRRDFGQAGNPALIAASKLYVGSSTPGYVAVWKSSDYANMTTAAEGSSTATGSGYLEDSNAAWFADQYKGFVLIDSALTEFAITSSTVSPRRLLVSGTPAGGAYRVTAGDPVYAVPFCTYLAANNGGDGYVKMEVTFDGGAHWLTVLDTSTTINMIGGIVEIAYPGDTYAFRLTLTNDGMGVGPFVFRAMLCTDPSVWQ